MHAIRVHSPGGVEQLSFEEIPEPSAGPEEVIITLKAIGVNYIDIYYRTGFYLAAVPFTIGLEGAGVISTIGVNVRDFKIGDRVAYTGILGAYAQKATVPAERLVKIPDDLSFQEAAAAMVQGITAQYLSTSTYPIKKGDTCLIHAAAGGVGLLLTQMAKMKGAVVIGTVSTEEKARLVQEAGCDHIIFYHREDFAKRVKELTNNRGVEVVYDGVGKATFDKSLDCLTSRGFMILFGQSSGPVPPFDLSQLAKKGSLFITRPAIHSYIASHQEWLWRANEVFALIQHKKIKLRVHHEYPLKKATQAHRALESRKTSGKLLLIPS